MTLFLSALLIFVLRLIDQSLTTVRALVVTKNPVLGAFIGLIESAIWIVAVSQVIKDINDPFLIAAYAFGFAAGTLLGIQLEKFIGLGSAVVRVFSPSKSTSISKILREKGFLVDSWINGGFFVLEPSVIDLLFPEKFTFRGLT